MFQTAGVPPSRGNTILANIGWSRNSNAELTKSVTVKRISIVSRDLGRLLAKRDTSAWTTRT